MNVIISRFAAGLVATSIFAGSALAQTAQPVSAASPLSAIDSAFAGSALADDDVLDAATAREDLSLVAQSQQSSSVSNSQVNGTSTTGGIGFSDNAFQGSSGLTIINANSGNNVAMNGSMNVNIIMTPATPQ